MDGIADVDATKLNARRAAHTNEVAHRRGQRERHCAEEGLEHVGPHFWAPASERTWSASGSGRGCATPARYRCGRDKRGRAMASSGRTCRGSARKTCRTAHARPQRSQSTIAHANAKWTCSALHGAQGARPKALCKRHGCQVTVSASFARRHSPRLQHMSAARSRKQRSG